MTSDAEKSFKAKLRAIAKEKTRDPADLWQSLTLERFLVRFDIATFLTPLLSSSKRDAERFFFTTQVQWSLL